MYKLKQCLVSILFILTAVITGCAPTTTLPQEQVTSTLPQPTQISTAELPLETLERTPIKQTEIITVTKEGTEEEMMTRTPSPLTSFSQDSLVQFVREDLSARLNIPLEAVELLKFESLQWPDGSLGCPQPGMAYTQVLVEGYRILLNYQGKVYSYHGSDKREPFLCPQASALNDTLLPPPGFNE